MTSTLPNFANAPVATATGSTIISPAGFAALGASLAEAGGDFASLMPAVKAEAPAVPALNGTTLVASVLTGCVASSGLAGTAAPAVESIPTENAVESQPVVSRDTLEQAAAFVASLMQAFLPEPVQPVSAATPAIAVNPSNEASLSIGTELSTGLAPSSETHAQSTSAAQPELCAPRTADRMLDRTPSATPLLPTTAPQTAAKSGVVPKSEATDAEFQVAYAADGAVEIKMDLPETKIAGEKNGTVASPLEIQAELELPGQAVMRFEATGSFSAPDQSHRGRAIFAGKETGSREGIKSGKMGSELNFVSTADERVKTASPGAGIPVAKSDATMSTATLEQPTAISTPEQSVALPVHGQFTVAWPAVEKTGEAIAAPLNQNFAERAVATVANLVDAQFSASMQKSGSVQLRLKFGGEDLSVRVELRGGAVHTDFRTDSAELRAALSREMQAVASQSPEQARRFLEPVFSPVSSSSSTSGNPFSSSSRQQQAAQQDLSQRSRRDQPEEAAPFARRSLLRESFFPEPVAPRAPVRLPTSLRLSALA